MRVAGPKTDIVLDASAEPGGGVAGYGFGRRVRHGFILIGILMNRREVARQCGGRNGFDGIESRCGGVPGSELPLNDRKNKTANNTQFAYAA